MPLEFQIDETTLALVLVLVQPDVSDNYERDAAAVMQQARLMLAAGDLLQMLDDLVSWHGPAIGADDEAVEFHKLMEPHVFKQARLLLARLRGQQSLVDEIEAELAFESQPVLAAGETT